MTEKEFSFREAMDSKKSMIHKRKSIGKLVSAMAVPSTQLISNPDEQSATATLKEKPKLSLKNIARAGRTSPSYNDLSAIQPMG